MDGVRYGLQQASWENSSALESYDPNLGSDLRGGGAYGDRGYVESHFVPREAGPPYPRAGYPGESDLDTDRFPRHGWPPSRRRSLDEEIPPQRGSHRLEKLNQGREAYQRPKRDYSLEGSGRDAPLLRDPSREGVLERIPSRTGSRDRENADGDLDWDFRRDRMPYQDGREGNQDLDMAELPRPRSGTPSRLPRDEALGLRGEDLSPRERSGRRSRGENRDSTRRRRDRDYVRSRSRSRERGHWSPDRGRGRDRGRSFGHDDRDFSRRSSRSPRSRSRGAGGRESSYEDLRGDRRRDRESSRYHASSVMTPSATLVVKGLSQKICEDDLYLALADWGPLRHVRVIKERSTGVSRGFAFVDFPDVDAAQKMMDGIGYEGIVIDGRRICFEYSSKPTGGPGMMPGPGRSSLMKSGLAGADWMCTVCGCNNFARRVVCFQCNEARTDESPAADLTAASGPGARRTSEGGPTHVLVVRGLDETVDEESLHCEFSKYAPLKDLRLVRDKFTSVSRGFAFIHFHSVEDAAKALGSTNGIALDKNGQLLRVAFAKSIGPASAATSQGSAAAAAAIEAATFAQQYDMIGWAPKEYNPGENLETGIQMEAEPEAENGAPQSSFVWDEASGYYYDAASGFYYDGNRGLYYDGNSGVWYTYDQDTLQYTPYVAPESTSIDAELKEVPTSTTTTSVPTSTKAVIISAPAMVTIESQPEPRKPTLAEAVAAAAEAAKSTTKKDKEKLKEKEREIRKSMIIGAGKKKMNNVMSVWKQRQHEGLAPEETNPSSSDSTVDGNANSAIGRGLAPARVVQTASTTPSKTVAGRGMSTLGRGGGNPFSGNYHPSEGAGRARPLTQSSGRGVSVFGVSSSAVQSGISVGRGSGRGRGSDSTMASLGASESPVVVTPFKTDASALGAFPNATTTTAATRRRFTETPQSGYRDRAAERRSLYASSLPGDVSEVDGKDKGKDMPFPPGVGARGVGRGSDMPFPPGVGGGGSKQGTEPSGAVMGGADSESFEVITAEKALDANNVGNRMLRNMGWQEGSGLGKEGTGIVEPVLAQGAGERAGLGSQSQQKKTDARFETLPGDSYRIVIQKKALARFHEMI